MFGLFKSPCYRDPQLGELVRKRGHWRGSLVLAGGESVPLLLAGSRTEPDEQAVAVARALPTQIASWRATIGEALFEHYGPYGEDAAAGEDPEPNHDIPSISAPSKVWPHVSLAFVSVVPIDGALVTELGYTTAWDDEHTLGLRFQSGKFIELCGSVLAP